MSKFDHIWRGCGTLPHVGEHPGTIWMFFFMFLGFIAGSEKGIKYGLVGVLLFALFFGPMYLYGAYERSVFSENLDRKEQQ